MNRRKKKMEKLNKELSRTRELLDKELPRTRELLEKTMFKVPVMTIRENAMKVVCRVPNINDGYPVDILKKEIANKLVDYILPFIQYDIEMENGKQVITGSVYVTKM